MGALDGREVETQRRFAVTSLGWDRWYWVVWPGSTELHMEEGNGDDRCIDNKSYVVVDEGIARSKMSAVDAALTVAGIDGVWVAAKFARAHYQRKDQQDDSTPTVQEHLYRDVYAPSTGQWGSLAHRIVKRTPRYVYVEPQHYHAGERTGSWGDMGSKPFRLDREMLESVGYAPLPLRAIEMQVEPPIDDPFFFTTPYSTRSGEFGAGEADWRTVLGLTPPVTEEAVKVAYRRLARKLHPDMGGSHEAFVALQRAYKQALRHIPRFKRSD